MSSKLFRRYTGNGDTQEDRILRRLIDANGGWVPAPELAKIALQYSRAVHFARRDGWLIENRVEWAGKVRHGFFRLITNEPGRTQPLFPNQNPTTGVAGEPNGDH